MTATIPANSLPRPSSLKVMEKLLVKLYTVTGSEPTVNIARNTHNEVMIAVVSVKIVRFLS